MPKSEMTIISNQYHGGILGKILMAMVCLFPVSVFANEKAFDLKMDLSIEGKHISSPRMVDKEGGKGTITQESSGQKSFIEVVAKEDQVQNGKQAIFMTFVVGKIANDRTRANISRPQIISIPNEKASFSIGKREIQAFFLFPLSPIKPLFEIS